MQKCILLVTICSGIFFSACKKSDFLDAKPDQSLVVPSTLADYQAILDNDDVMNGAANGGRGLVPEMGETGADNYYVSDDNFNSTLTPLYQNYYIWK